jgi:hypothetical protein
VTTAPETSSSSASGIPAPPTIVVPKKTTKGPKITYIWMPDAKGNLVKADASIVKKSFAKLPGSAQVALTQYLLTIANKQPTDTARQALWNDIVDGAIAAFKEGKKQSPWDVLNVLTKNSPAVNGESVTYTEYDSITSDALLGKIAQGIGFDINQLTSADKKEFFDKLNKEAKASGKTTTRKAATGGMETIVTPSLFNAKDFTESFLWAKVNFDDTTKLPSSAITQISSIKSILKANGISDLSQKEINALGVALASGKQTIDALKKDLGAKAALRYPLFAKRLQDTPGLTVMDVVEPYITQMAKYWEVDPNTVDLDNPDLDKFVRPDGTAGNVPMGSLSDWISYLKNHPNSEKASWSKDLARDNAVGVARAMGFGV